MYRGTTPTLTFRLPIDTGSITALSLAVAQRRRGEDREGPCGHDAGG